MEEKEQVRLLLVHGQVMTMDAERRVFTDGAVAVGGTDIVAVGRTEDIVNEYQAKETWDAGGALIRPGYTEGHAHVVDQILGDISLDTWEYTCGAGDAYDVEWHEWVLPHWQTETPETEYLGSLLSFMEMVRNGSTSFIGGCTHFTPAEVIRAANQVGIRGVVGEFLWDLPEEPKRLAHLTPDLCEERLRSQIEEFGLFGPDRRVGVASMVLGMGTCSDGLMQVAKRVADEHGCMCYVHQSYGQAERHAYMRDLTGGVKPIHHFAKLGILGPNLALIHANFIDDDELDLIVESGTCCIHNPAASLKVGLGASRYAKFPEMLERGVYVGLGSDSSNWSNFFDINMQIYLAAVIHREARMKTPTITAEQALEMATLNAAHILGLPDLVGAIEPGRRADIVIYDRDRPEWHPQPDLVNALVYAGQSKGIDTVIVDGEVVLRHGRFTKFDQDAAYEEIDRQAWSIATRLGFPQLRWPHIQ